MPPTEDNVSDGPWGVSDGPLGVSDGQNLFEKRFWIPKALKRESSAFAGGYIRVFGFEWGVLGCIDKLRTSPEAITTRALLRQLTHQV